MKSLAKYRFSLFILLLVGYTQVFAPMYGAMVSQDSELEHVQVPFIKSTDIESLENEEELKRNFFKEPARDNADFVCAYLLQQFIQHLKNQSSFARYSSCISFYTSPDRAPDVLRL